jgi:hypothetical protein
MKKSLFSFFLFSLILFSSISLVSAIDSINIIPNFRFTGSNLQSCINLVDYFEGFNYISVNYTTLDGTNYSVFTDSTDIFKRTGWVDSRYTISLQRKSPTNWELCLIGAYTTPYYFYPLEIWAWNKTSEEAVAQFVAVIADNADEIDENFYLPKVTDETLFNRVINLGYDGMLIRNLDDVFSDFDSLSFDIYDYESVYITTLNYCFSETGDNPNPIERGHMSEACCYDTDTKMWFCLYSGGSGDGIDYTLGQSFIFKAYSDKNDTILNVKMTAFNDYGSVFRTMTISTSSDINDVVNEDDYLFIYNSTGGTTHYSDGTIINPTYTGTSFLGYLSSLFDVIFPNKDSLTLKQKFSYVLITFFLIDFLILILCFKSQNIKLAGILIIIIDVLMFFYFLAIGYIPITILIIFILIALVFSFFKIKAGG